MDQITKAREERRREDKEIINVAAREVTKFRPQIPTGVRLTLITGFASPPRSSLGGFRNLPVELVQDIVSLLDVQTCFRLRHVNRLFREMVTDTPEYKEVAVNALAMLRKVFHVGLAPQLGISKLQDAIRSTKCMDCGHDGSQVYLLTMTRHCEECCHISASTLPKSSTASLSSIAKAARMSLKRMSKMLPVAQVTPGHGSYPVIHKQVRLVNRQEALAVVRLLQGTELEPERDLLRGAYFEFSLVCAFAPFFDKETSQWYLPLTCQGCHNNLLYARLSVTTQVDQQRLLDLEKEANRQFTRAGFLAHFATCLARRRSGRSTF
jgi:hypothetical protein